MTLDLKSEALAFCREYQFVPACLVQAAMERGAELSLLLAHRSPDD
jgi:hypothetical protein